MKEDALPYTRMIFVCTNTREGRAACGNADRGESSGLKVLEALKEEVKARGLKREIRVARSGCMDLCGLGPNAAVFESEQGGKLICRISAEDVPKLLDKFIRRRT